MLKIILTFELTCFGAEKYGLGKIDIKLEYEMIWQYQGTCMAQQSMREYNVLKQLYTQFKLIN